jgi:opacity protein-like surface antigen
MKTRTMNNAILATLLLTSISFAQAGDDLGNDDFTGNISGFLGEKSLDDKNWGELDSQGSLGMILDFKKQSWPVSIAVDVILAGNEDRDGGVKTEGGTLEAHIGVRKIFEISGSSFQPYIGGGVALVAADVRNRKDGNSASLQDDDTVFGTWVGGGLYYAATNQLNIGLDLRYSKAEVSLFDEDREAGGFYAGITTGYHWLSQYGNSGDG